MVKCGYMTGDVDFLTISEFSKLVRVHPNTIRRAIKNGRIKAFKVGIGKRSIYRISKEEINRVSFCDLEMMVKKIIEEKGLKI